MQRRLTFAQIAGGVAGGFAVLVVWLAVYFVGAALVGQIAPPLATHAHLVWALAQSLFLIGVIGSCVVAIRRYERNPMVAIGLLTGAVLIALPAVPCTIGFWSTAAGG